MAIETSFVIKQVSVDDALREAEAKADASAKRMDASLQGTRGASKGMEANLRNAAKGMDAINKAGGKAGGVLKNLTQAASSMLNPIALCSAGITAIIALVTRLYQHAKEKAAQLVASYEWEAKQATSAYDVLRAQGDSDGGYFRRLQAINEMEIVDNGTKMEAARIVEYLTARYGELGLSIDATTGKIGGLTGAMRQYSQQVREAEEAALQSAIVKQENVLRGQIGQQYATDKGDSRLAILKPFNPLSKEDEIAIAQAPGSKLQDRLVEQKLPLAVQRYVGVVGLEAAQKGANWDVLKQYYTPPQETDQMKEIRRQMDETQALWGAQTTTPEQMKNLEKQYGILKQMLRTQQQMQTAYDLQGDQGLAKEDAEHWRKVYEEASEYYALLVRMRNLLRTGNDAGDFRTSQMQQGEALARQLQDAYRKREEAVARLGQAERDTGLDHEDVEGLSGALPQRRKRNPEDALRQQDTDVSDAIMRDRIELEQLHAASASLEEELAKYDALRDENGNIADEDWARAYLELSNELLENKAKQATLEASIANSQAEQISVQNKLLELEEEKLKLEEAERKRQLDKAKSQAMESLKELSAYGERTNALTQRGGYLGNVNTINALQVNRQILSNVITATAYLQRINSSLADVGRI